VIVAVNPAHFAEPEIFHRRYGTRYFPMRSLVEANIPVAVGSDGPMNPFLNIMFATTHPYNREEAISRRQAVEAYTRGSAYAEFAEKEKGTVTRGKLADLTVLSQDIFAAPDPELPKTQSILTIIGGRIVYDAKAR
jgi:predicted amidohydrolase YtcJ